MKKLLQMDYLYDGPWGDQMADAYKDLAARISDVPGLIWKIWTENREEGIAGGLYLFEDEASLNEYLVGKVKRMNDAGIKGLRVRKFDINVPLTVITRGGPCI